MRARAATVQHSWAVLRSQLMCLLFGLLRLWGGFRTLDARPGALGFYTVSVTVISVEIRRNTVLRFSLL